MRAVFVVPLASVAFVGCTILTSTAGLTGDEPDAGTREVVEASTDGTDGADTATLSVLDAGSTAETGADVGAVDAGTGRLILCGDTSCPLTADSVCCFDGQTGVHACTTRAACTTNWLSCDDTKDCAALGQPSFTCCADSPFNDAGTQTTRRSTCGAPANCNASGPVDQLCDPLDPSECKQAGDGRTFCKTPSDTIPFGTYGYCTSP